MGKKKQAGKSNLKMPNLVASAKARQMEENNAAELKEVRKEEQRKSNVAVKIAINSKKQIQSGKMAEEMKRQSAELKYLCDTLAQAQERESTIVRERDEALKFVTQMEMDAALTQQKLDKALLELLQPGFVFEKERSGKRSKS